MKKIINKNGIINFVIAFGLFLFQSIFILPFIKLGLNINNITIEQNVYISLFAESIVCLILLFLFKDYLEEKWLDFKQNYKEYLKLSFSNWAKGLAIMYISNFILMLIIGDQAANQNTIVSMIKIIPIGTLILTTILAPLTEELIFRKSLKDAIPNEKIFPIISGLLFGFMHVTSSASVLEYLYIIPYGALGYYFAKTLAKTDNIYSTIAIHFFHNFIFSIVLFL